MHLFKGQNDINVVFIHCIKLDKQLYIITLIKPLFI